MCLCVVERGGDVVSSGGIGLLRVLGEGPVKWMHSSSPGMNLLACQSTDIQLRCSASTFYGHSGGPECNDFTYTSHCLSSWQSLPLTSHLVWTNN